MFWCGGIVCLESNGVLSMKDILIIEYFWDGGREIASYLAKAIINGEIKGLSYKPE